MKKAVVLIYDGSFNGFLTAVFTAFEQGITVADIQPNDEGQNRLFSESQTIFTQMDKAKRVWEGVHSRSQIAIKNIYFAFLSERKGISMLLYKYIVKLCAADKVMARDFSADAELKIQQLAKLVAREKNRMEAFAQFKLTKDGVYFSGIEPEFNVLPLISKHFRSRYPDQHWLIYDMKRKYGLFYNGDGVEIISMDLAATSGSRQNKSDTVSDAEYTSNDSPYDCDQDIFVKSLIHRKVSRQSLPKSHSVQVRTRKAV